MLNKKRVVKDICSVIYLYNLSDVTKSCYILVYVHTYIIHVYITYDQINGSICLSGEIGKCG